MEAVRAHQSEFQEFADLSNGTREASTLGYQLSADYVAGLLEAAGYEVTRQPFEYNFFEELAPATALGTSPGFPFTYTDGVNISTMDYSGTGTVTGVVQGVNDNIVPLPVGEPDGTSNAGCDTADFADFTGDIALIQRGTCDFSVKIANAVEAGADAVIIFNEGNSEERTGIDFGQASFPQDVPVIEMSSAAGAALVEFIEAEAAVGRAGDDDDHHDHRVGGARVRERDRRDDDGPDRSSRRVRCAPRLGDRGSWHQRQRIRIGSAARSRAADGRARHRARSTRCGSSGSGPRRPAWSDRRTTSVS